MPRKLLILLPALLLFWGLAYAPFWNPDEGRYVAASYEMTYGFGPNSATGQAPDWLVPHLNTLTRLNKPPLVYWVTSLSFSAFGPSEWSGRLGSALASLLILVLLYVWASRAISWRAGLGAAIVWATAVFPAAMGRTANTDMLLSAAMFLVAFGVFWTVEGPPNARFRHAILAGVGIGAAMLAKGPVGVALPGLVLVVYLFAARGWKRVPWGAAGTAMGLGLVISLPWFLAVEMRQNGFLERFLLSENLSRFAGGEQFHDPTSPFYYMPVLLGGLMPWTAFLIPALFWRDQNGIRHGEVARRTLLFAFLWGVLIVLFFSPSQTKLISYILPAFPAICLLLGVGLANWKGAPRAAKNSAIALALALNVGLFIAISALPDWVLKPGVLMDERIWPRERGLPWVWGIGALLATSSALLLWGARRNDGRAMLAAGGVGGAANLVVLLALAGQIAPYEDGSGVVTALASRLKPEDRVVGYRSFLPTTIYYARRPVTFFHFINKSGLIPSEVQGSPFFFEFGKENDLLGWQKQNPGRTFLITGAILDAPLQPFYHYWGRNNRFFLYSNAPKPADFVLENVAPLRVQPKGVQRSLQPQL